MVQVPCFVLRHQQLHALPLFFTISTNVSTRFSFLEKVLLYYILYIVLHKIVLTWKGLRDHQGSTDRTLRTTPLDYRLLEDKCLSSLYPRIQHSTYRIALRKHVFNECVCSTDSLDPDLQNPMGSTRQIRHCSSLGFLVQKRIANKNK